MLYTGVLSIILCAVQVISFPASGRDTEDDTKVMKCIVEVISDTLSKPNPVPTSEDCLETLRGDERIISILRHQNLLKELQELAAQGVMERLKKQKKNGGFVEELSSILEKQSNKPLPSAKSQIPALLENYPVREEKRQSEEEERKRSSERLEEDDSAEELQSNEISKREETSEDEEMDNRITDEINEMELPKDNQENASEGRTPEEETVTTKDQEADEKEDPHKQDSNETNDEEDETQREDNSMRTPEESKSESDASKETTQDAETTDCAEENPRSDEVTSSKDLGDSKRWNKMDELAKELRAKKCAARRSEDDPNTSMKIPPKEPKYNSRSQVVEDQTQWQRSHEDNAETEAPMLKRGEEEGSANRKTEEQELESLAAIEAELENVAHKLHDLRRG